jgi:hypothetical protein
MSSSGGCAIGIYIDSEQKVAPFELQIGKNSEIGRIKSGIGGKFEFLLDHRFFPLLFIKAFRFFDAK